MAKHAEFRFYEELNDFLPQKKKKQSIEYCFYGNPSVKDAIESFGIPHVEVYLIIVNCESVDFDYIVKDNDRIAAYPVFESIDITPVIKLRVKSFRKISFILDVHLGKLARYLRILGFDTLYENNYDDSEIINIACKEHRIILTRDIGILKNNLVTHGYWLRSQNSKEQVDEVLHRFNLFTKIKPFERCSVCNGMVEKIDKYEIESEIPPLTKMHFDVFYRCNECKKIYWEGSHYHKIVDFINGFYSTK